MKWLYGFLLFGQLVLHAQGVYGSPELDELRLEINDIKYALHTAQVDISLIDERSKKPSQFAALEKRIAALEKTLDKVVADLRMVSTTISQVDARLLSQDERLQEVGKLKSTLTSIAKAVNTPPVSKAYKVKAGDSLEKIAKAHHMSVDTLRKLNHLKQDKIVVGQELVVSDEP